MNSSGFETIDYVIFGGYIVLLICLGLFLSRNKKGEEKNANAPLACNSIYINIELLNSHQIYNIRSLLSYHPFRIIFDRI